MVSQSGQPEGELAKAEAKLNSKKAAVLRMDRVDGQGEVNIMTWFGHV